MEILIVIIAILGAAIAGWGLAKAKYKSIPLISAEDLDKLKDQLNFLNTEKLVAENQISNIENAFNELKVRFDDKDSQLQEVNGLYTSSSTDVKNLKEKLSELKLDYEKRDAELNNKIINGEFRLAELTKSYNELNDLYKDSLNDNKNLTEKLSEQKFEIEQLQAKFTKEFENLANRIFEDKSIKFTEQNKVNLDIILKPLNDKIKDFEKRVEVTYEKEARDRTSLSGEIKRLHDLNQQISKEAHNLTTALTGQGKAKTQGNWGEMILESILEQSGLVKDREYFIQSSFLSDNGSRFQPDVVVKYPGERDIVIDSKVSLNAYERYSNAGSKEEQIVAINEHIKAIKHHIERLSNKNYHDLYSLHSLDFVMLFIPIEPAYLAAIQYDPGLWSFAYEKRILLISPTNLIAVLKMAEQLWKQEYQSQNAFEIAKSGGELYDKFVGFVEDLQNVGKRIDDSKKYYDAAMNKLSEGKGNLIRRAETMKGLGIKSKKSIPKELIKGLELDNDETLFYLEE